MHEEAKIEYNIYLKIQALFKILKIIKFKFKEVNIEEIFFCDFIDDKLIILKNKNEVLEELTDLKF